MKIASALVVIFLMFLTFSMFACVDIQAKIPSLHPMTCENADRLQRCESNDAVCWLYRGNGISCYGKPAQ